MRRAQYPRRSSPPGTTLDSGDWAPAWPVSIAPNFEGYMIAVCNFQLAHGYAFISDLGAQKLAHGYLALILTNAATSTRLRPTPEMLEN